jgi:hypothetical protein
MRPGPERLFLLLFLFLNPQQHPQIRSDRLGFVV